MKNRLRLTSVLLVLSTAALLVASTTSHAGGSRADGDPIKPVTVILVRHAETAGDTNTVRDPALSDVGAARAKSLARLVSNAGVTHLYSTPYVRTASTLAPLAEATKLEIEKIGGRETAKQVAAVKALDPGSIAVIAGHSNTVPQMVKALGGGEISDLDEKGYIQHDVNDRLFIVTLPAGEGALTQVVELRYGE